VFGLGLLMTEQAEQKFVAGVGASAALQLAWHWTTVDFKPNVNASVDVCCGVQSQILAEPSSSAALNVVRSLCFGFPRSIHGGHCF